MSRTLVVFHSRSGHTRRVAKALAERLDADLDEIVVRQARHGPLGYARCALEALSGCAATVRATEHDPAGYDWVLIGTPIWFWRFVEPGSSLGARPSLRRCQARFLLHDGRLPAPNRPSSNSSRHVAARRGPRWR